jgi:hypothetical protein
MNADVNANFNNAREKGNAIVSEQGEKESGKKGKQRKPRLKMPKKLTKIAQKKENKRG